VEKLCRWECDDGSRPDAASSAKWRKKNATLENSSAGRGSRPATGPSVCSMGRALRPQARHQMYTDAFGETVKESDPMRCLLAVFAQSDAEEWLEYRA